MAVPQPAATSNTSATSPDSTDSTTSTDTAREVMGPGDVSRALRRVAHEILERNKGVGDLVLLGIPSRGVPLAHRLAAVMAEVEGAPVAVGSLDVTMHRDDLRHQPVRSLARTDIPAGGIDDKVVVLVDDVLYHGRTVRAALEALAELGRPRSVRLAVLVDRGHRELPIRADHVGKNLPTAASERVRVRLTEVDGVDGADAGDAVTISGGDR